MLTVEIEYLTGVVRAANARGDAPDWPPQPDRLFSALVASWAARGRDPAEQKALEWLEQQTSPLVEACEQARARTVVPVFVPPNDDAAGSVTIMPERRRRQERRFPACVPDDPLVRVVWPSEPEPEILAALAAIAHDTSYLGHSASLVRCRALRGEPGQTTGMPARRSVYPGRLAELERAFQGQRRPAPGIEFPRAAPAAADRPPQSVFGTDWLVFRDEGGTTPDPTASCIAAKTLLKTLQAGYGEGAAPAWITGHAADGRPLASPHLACIPLLDVGWTWSEGRLMGLAVVLPRSLEEASRRARDPDAPTIADADMAAQVEEEGLLRVIARQGSFTPPTLQLRLSRDVCWTVAYDREPQAQSLRSHRYLQPAYVWGTVTPIALDRHPRMDGDIEASIAEACIRIGLPRPRVVVPGKHAALSGTEPAQRRHGAPAWAGWRLIPSLVGRRLTHAVIEFDMDVAGPVILGAGRFCGLGLCLPLDGRPSA